MYCSSCGGAVAPGLTYCNHCGGNLRGTKESVAKVLTATPDNVVWAIVGVFVVGLGSIMGLMALLKEEFNANIGQVLIFSFAVFLLTFLVECVFISLLFTRRSSTKEVGGRRLKEQTTKELDVAQPHVLEEPIYSVTEHTTRAFEPIYRQKKAE